MALLVAVLIAAVVRPFGLPEALIAAPVAAVALATGVVSMEGARAECGRLAPVIGFLAAVLILAWLCDNEGLFHACGTWLAHNARDAKGLLAGVFAIASVVTAVLSLDTTVVLLTPIVVATAATMGVRPTPHVFACAHLSNSASLLLPVSNLTNLLAFSACGLTFTHYSALMAGPWIAAVVVEYAVFRWFFADHLAAGSQSSAVAEPVEIPMFAIGVVATTLAGFALASSFGFHPAWAAACGAAVLAARGLARRSISLTAMIRAADFPFLVFVVALAIVVRAVTDNGLADALHRIIPHGSGLASLFGVAVVAAVLANVVNNLPAVLVLLPLTVGHGPSLVLAMLLGVNIGPNLTYAGSLATLLWRRIARRHLEVNLGEFTRLGLATTPATLAAAVLALWMSSRIVGP